VNVADVAAFCQTFPVFFVIRGSIDAKTCGLFLN
jgi:hypothetical protein